MRRLAWLPLVLVACSALDADPSHRKVLAYNVLFHGSDMDASVALIADENPDVVCLTELTRPFARRLLERVGDRYPHRALSPRSGTWGVGVVSRYPILRSGTFPQLPHQIPGMEAVLAVDGREVTVACLHFMAPLAKHRGSDSLLTTLHKNEDLREAQAKGLVARFAGRRGPVLLVGDFNESPSGRGYRALTEAGFVPACDVDGSDCGASWPGATTWVPAFIQIDHVLGRGVRFAGARVIRGGGSDHYPIAATFAVEAPRKR